MAQSYFRLSNAARIDSCLSLSLSISHTHTSLKEVDGAVGS